MDIEGEVLSRQQVSAGVPASIAPKPEAARSAELAANVDEVAEKLAAMGHDPLVELARIAQSDALSDAQKAAVNRWIMPYRYPQKRAVELTGRDGGPIPLVLTQDDAEL